MLVYYKSLQLCFLSIFIESAPIIFIVLHAERTHDKNGKNYTWLKIFRVKIFNAGFFEKILKLLICKNQKSVLIF